MSSFIARSIAAVAATAALAAGSAHASDVHWSVGIQAPIGPGVSVGTVFSNSHLPVVAPLVAPMVVPPVYMPAPVVYAPPLVVATPVVAPRVVYGAPVAYGAPVWVGGRWVRYPVQGHRYPGAWRSAFDHRGPALPGRVPGREVRY